MNEFGAISVREDHKRDIFLLKCDITQKEGRAGWDEVTHYILREDPRIQKFIVDEFRALYNKRTRKQKRETAMLAKRGRKYLSKHRA